VGKMTKNIEEISGLLQKHFHKSEKSMLSMGIRVGGETQYFSMNIPIEESERSFGLGSISKTIISTYVCEMIHKKTIDVDKKVCDYLPLNPKIKYPTILQLLTHTSGYHAFIPLLPSFWILLTKGFNKKNIYHKKDVEWLKKSLLRIRPFRKKKYRYADYNYAVLAVIIEEIEQKPFKEIIIDYVQQEIGMMNTYYGSINTTKDDKYSWLWEDDNAFLPSGGLFSTVNDVLKFLNYQINNQEKLSFSHTKYHKMNSHKNVFTGYSWNSFYNGKFFWHIGGQGYYRSYALFDLKKDISIVILSTVEINIQHVNRLGSSLYRNAKRNNTALQEFLQSYDK